MNRTFENEYRGDAAIVEVGAASQSFYYPRSQSVRGRVLGAFLRGERLTQQDSLRRFSDLRLAAQVESLRKVGWAIQTDMVEVSTRDAGRRAEVAQYHLPNDAIADAGEKGSQYAEAAHHAEISRGAT